MLQGGDLIAHALNLDEDLANTIQIYVLKRIKTYFPHSAVLFLIGNNDLLKVKKSIIESHISCRVKQDGKAPLTNHCLK